MNGPFTEADVRTAYKAVYGHEQFGSLFVLEWVDFLNAAYRSAASRPDGWVACPKEALDEMLQATCTQNRPLVLHFTTPAERAQPFMMAKFIYRAMLAASPYALKDEAASRLRPPVDQPSADARSHPSGWTEDDLNDGSMGG